MLCIVQARMSSKRLPGKTLKKINSKPLIYYLIKSLKRSNKIKQIIVATSNRIDDKKILSYCKRNNILYYAGPLKNVSLRFKKILENTKFTEFIRVSADSPLLDYKIINKAISIYNKSKPDIVTNIFKRTFPKGQSVEIIKKQIFLKNYINFKKPEELEHVTSYFYNNKKKFNIVNFRFKYNISDINLSVDNMKDFRIVQKILKKVKNNDLSKILRLIK